MAIATNFLTTRLEAYDCKGQTQAFQIEHSLMRIIIILCYIAL